VSEAPYVCDDDDRRRAVRAEATINGIDFLEVDESQTQIDVTFIHPLPGEAGEIPAGPELEMENVLVEGGVRIAPIRVTGISRPDPRVLRVTVDPPGDFSPYTFRLIAGAGTDSPPPGFDPTLSSASISFKATCATDLPCKTGPDCTPVPGESPVIDYLAKDYDSFRSLMLARLRQLMPHWQDTSPADPYIAAVETLAYAADRLSYMQDAAGGEAYLATARNRISVSRHARLIGYRISSGINARTFVSFGVGAAAEGQMLNAGTPVLSRTAGLGTDIDVDQYETAVAAGAEVFETLTDVRLHADHGAIAFHTWSRRACCLTAGSTRATLVNTPALSLATGDYLLLIQTAGPNTGNPADADPELTHVVRLTEVTAGTDPLDASPVMEIAWAEDDALPFDLPLSGPVGTDGANMALAEARGNMALADHGGWITAPLLPDTVPAEGPYRPCIVTPGVTWSVPFDPATASARAALETEPTEAKPRGLLTDATGNWTFQHDLLASDRFATDVVAELDDDGFTWLRFGDDLNGRKPTPLNTFTASVRIGNGTAGNVGRNTLAHVFSGAQGAPIPGILSVTNPLPGQGGQDPETAAHARLFAPASVHRQERAVTEVDWADWALRYPGVQRAAAELRWTGSWYTVFVTVDRIGGADVSDDDGFRTGLLAHLNRARLAGYDLELRDPVFAPLRLSLRICVARDHARAAVRSALLDRFTAGMRRDGTRGFFHPDNYSFGDPVFSSRIHAAAMEVDGVGSVEILDFHRWDRVPNEEITEGVFRPGDREIVQLENDPNFPERGTLTLEMEGSL
jgi:hypothetical protein